MNNIQIEETFIDRTIYLFGEIDTEMAKDVISKIDLINEYDDIMEEEDASTLEMYISRGTIDKNSIKKTNMRKPIRLEINSSGGETSAGYSIITAIENSETPIIGYVTGNCMSMAVAIVSSCHYRVSSEYAEFMVHDVYSGMQGKYSDLNSSLEYIERVRKNYNKVLTRYTKLKEDKVDELVSKNSDHYFSPFDAKVMGIIDRIDNEPIDEEEFFNKLHADDGGESQKEPTDDNKVNEIIENIVEEDEVDSELNVTEENLRTLQKLLGLK